MCYKLFVVSQGHCNSPSPSLLKTHVYIGSHVGKAFNWLFMFFFNSQFLFCSLPPWIDSTAWYFSTLPFSQAFCICVCVCVWVCTLETSTCTKPQLLSSNTDERFGRGESKFKYFKETYLSGVTALPGPKSRYEYVCCVYKGKGIACQDDYTQLA